MQPLRIDRPNPIIELPVSRGDLGSGRALRLAAATVAEDRRTDFNVTRVVGELGRDDPSAFEAYVAQLAQEFELDTRVRFSGGGFSVRFSRPAYSV